MSKRYATRILSFIPHMSSFNIHAIIGLDYDIIARESLEEELKKFQKRYSLGDFYVFINPVNKHVSAVSFSLMDKKELNKFVAEASIDPMQKKAYALFNCLGFRISEKIKDDMYQPYFIVEAETAERKYSSAYHEFFSQIYSDFIKEYPADMMFGDKIVIIERYPIRMLDGEQDTDGEE